MEAMPNIYWIIANVVFATPLSIFDDNDADTNEHAYGYYKELGVTANNEEHAKSICNEHLHIADDLSVSDVIKYEHIGIISSNEVQSEIFDDKDINGCLLQSPHNEGIWYVSGRGFYNDQDS